MLNVDSSVSLNPELMNSVANPSSALPSDIRDDLLRSGTILIAQRKVSTNDQEKPSRTEVQKPTRTNH